MSTPPAVTIRLHLSQSYKTPIIQAQNSSFSDFVTDFLHRFRLRLVIYIFVTERMSFVKNTDMKKSITEFLAGGLFAFVVFAVSGFVIYFAQAQGLFELVKSLAFASADISSYHSAKGEASASESESSGLMPELNTKQEQDLSYPENELIISDKLERLVLDTGWPIDQAPKETEEPEDKSEAPAGELRYPTDLGEDGGRIIRRTYTYNPSTTCINLPNGGMLRNSADIDMDYIAEQVLKQPELEISLDGSPQVLIMHTHTTECYEPEARDRFDADFGLRTTDLDKSVVAVGDEITAALEAAGIGVIHDCTVHDYPRYTGAYDRSSETVERILGENPSIKIVLDIHRDAIESDGERYAPVCTVDGQTAAQIMIICGCTNVPQYRYNLRFGAKLQSKLETDYPGFTRPLLVAERNYNQELTKASILIEMGSSSNSLDEAEYSGKLLGMSLAEMLLEMAE